MSLYNRTSEESKPIQVLLADDNRDDRFFFENVLNDITIPTDLTTFVDGERLLNYLLKNTEQLPDVIFLDLNMPHRNGSDCLKEIKLNKALQHLPVIIYSTSLHDVVTDQLYKHGAHYYIPKTNLFQLKNTLNHIFTLIAENKFQRPSREYFILSLTAVSH